MNVEGAIEPTVAAPGEGTGQEAAGDTALPKGSPFEIESATTPLDPPAPPEPFRRGEPITVVIIPSGRSR